MHVALLNSDEMSSSGLSVLATYISKLVYLLTVSFPFVESILMCTVLKMGKASQKSRISFVRRSLLACPFIITAFDSVTTGISSTKEDAYRIKRLNKFNSKRDIIIFLVVTNACLGIARVSEENAL